MKIPQDMQIGSTHHIKNQGEIEIIDYNGSANILVRFKCTGYEVLTQSSHIRRNNVKNRFKPSVAEVGFIGGVKHKATSNAYSVWFGMINRCYNKKEQEKHPTYKGCIVCDEWHNFQNFAEWFYENYIEGFELDKDSLSGECRGKIYSPKSCRFISKQENVEVSQSKYWLFTNPNGERVEIFNLTKFCRSSDLDQRNMNALHKGKINKYKGWTRA